MRVALTSDSCSRRTEGNANMDKVGMWENRHLQKRTTSAYAAQQLASCLSWIAKPINSNEPSARPSAQFHVCRS